jgi:hypothetical protein
MDGPSWITCCGEPFTGTSKPFFIVIINTCTTFDGSIKN